MTQSLYILAFDHRTSFQRSLFKIAGAPSAAERARMAAAKEIVLDGLLAARDSVDPAAIGVLTDEQLGAAAARRAKAEGVPLAICAERSSVAEFELEYGDDFAAHIDAFAPDFVKVLVRYDPDGDAALNRRQAARLRTLSDWLSTREPKLLFELLVPDSAPERIVRAIDALQAAGVEPDLWKVQGLAEVAHYEAVAAAARAGGRDDVGCVVLGAGAAPAVVEGWLRTAAEVPGFVGFAIGRTIFWEPLRDWIAGREDDEGAAARIAENYRRAVAVFDRSSLV